MKTDKDIEVVSMQLNGRGIVDCSEILRERCKQLNDGGDFRSLDLGFELPDKFLQLDGPQPTLAQLTVLASKLAMRLCITHIELLPIENEGVEK